MEITSLISYCSIDNAFIDHTIQQCQVFSQEIIVSSLTHLFTGVPDDLSYLGEMKKKYPEVKFITSTYEGREPFPRFYNCLQRWNGMGVSTKDYILLLDSDEVPEGGLMKKYLQEKELSPFDAVSFDCYWYFREPIFRSKKLERCGVIVDKNSITKNLTFNKADRWAYINKGRGLSVSEHQQFEDRPIFHHYSWVRDKEGMIRKATNFGHRAERDWKSLIEEEFSHPFNGKDFIHDYEYETVENIFGIKV
jgi:uncharacterized short protein YbdD (DUF466 family)